MNPHTPEPTRELYELSPVVTSVRNPRFAVWNALRSREDRAQRGVFLLDGEKLAAQAVALGQAKCLLVDESRLSAFVGLVRQALTRDVEVVPMASHLVDKLSQTLSPQGIIAVATLPTPPAPDAMGPRVIALDGVQDAGNVGTIIRTADAAGLTGVLLTSACADPYSMKSIRASMGSIFRVPTLASHDASGIMAGMKARGARVLAASMVGVSYKYINTMEPWVLVIGSEGRGISDAFMSNADEVVSIPMRGGAESLNAAVAAGVLMYALAMNQ